MVLLAGCGRREIVRPTPQMDVESQFWVRVLLLSSATECTVASPSVMHVDHHDFSAMAPGGEPVASALEGPVKVTLSDGRIVLGTAVQRVTRWSSAPSGPTCSR
jgi:hypothetical protein